MITAENIIAFLIGAVVGMGWMRYTILVTWNEEPEFKTQTKEQLLENMSDVTGVHTMWEGEEE